jgi:hypothetical protein
MLDQTKPMILIANDDGKKMVEREDLYQFLEEYARVTGTQLIPIAAGERPDFVCEKRGRRYGLELVKAMRNPVQRRWEVILGGTGHLSGHDATLLVQDVAYAKDKKRASPGWSYPKSTILVIQLIGSDGEEMVVHLDNQLMDEMAETGFREIWIADYSPMEAYRTIQLIGVKPKRWRGLHRHRLFGTKPYG